MKIRLTLLSIFGGAWLFSCENNSLSRQIAIEQQRQDSLMQVGENIIAEQRSRDIHAIEEADKIKKDKAEADESDQKRIKKEHEESRKFNEMLEKESKANSEKYKEFERQQLSEDQKGPRWLDGTWSITTTDYNPFNGQSSIIRSAIAIDWEHQSLMCFIENELIEYGRYTVNDGAIHCGSSYWRIDDVNLRLEFGKGKYYTKN